jgi:hypothetical protein
MAENASSTRHNVNDSHQQNGDATAGMSLESKSLENTIIEVKENLRKTLEIGGKDRDAWRRVATI